MYQEFMILSLETDLIEKKFIVTTNNIIDPNSIDDIVIQVYERGTKSPVMFDLEILGEKLEVTLKDWPVPNSSYVLYIKTLKNVLGQELKSGIKRKMEFPSCITKMARIESPAMHQVLKELLIKTAVYDTVEQADTDEASINEVVHIQISTDNAFYNIVRDTTTQDSEILLTDIANEQYFIRARVESIVDDKFQYGKWCDTITFTYGKECACIEEEDADLPYLPEYDDMIPVIEEETEFTFVLMNAINTTPQCITLKANKAIHEEKFDPSRISVASSRGPELFELTTTQSEIRIILEDGVKDNEVYVIQLHDVLAKDGTTSEQTLKLVTKMRPFFSSVYAVKSLIGEYKISDEIIAFNIKEASKYAMYVINNSEYPFKIDEDDVPFIVEQFVKYYAAHECLLRYTVELSSSTGMSGTIGNVTFNEKQTVKDITALLKHFCDEVEKWKEALKGYELEGRARVRSGVRGLYASPETTPLALGQRTSYGRGNVYGGSYRGGY